LFPICFKSDPTAEHMYTYTYIHVSCIHLIHTYTTLHGIPSVRARGYQLRQFMV